MINFEFRNAIIRVFLFLFKCQNFNYCRLQKHVQYIENDAHQIGTTYEVNIISFQEQGKFSDSRNIITATHEVDRLIMYSLFVYCKLYTEVIILIHFKRIHPFFFIPGASFFFDVNKKNNLAFSYGGDNYSKIKRKPLYLFNSN
jgi:hypothetical protein